MDSLLHSEISVGVLLRLLIRIHRVQGEDDFPRHRSMSPRTPDGMKMMMSMIASPVITGSHSFATRRYSGMKVMTRDPMIGPARLWERPPTTAYIMTYTELPKPNAVGTATRVQAVK